MAKSLEKLSENIGLARDIRRESTGFYRELISEYREARLGVSYNSNLSVTGKAFKLEELSREYTAKAMETAKGISEEYSKALIEARDGAEAFILSELPKVDANKQRLFDMRYEELKNSLAFKTNYDDAKEVIEQITELADEPKLAKQVSQEFVGLTRSAIELVTDQDKRSHSLKELGRIMHDLNDRSQTSEIKEARELRETAGKLMDASLASPIVKDALGEISQDASHYIDNPTEYFDKVETKS